MLSGIISRGLECLLLLVFVRSLCLVVISAQVYKGFCGITLKGSVRSAQVTSILILFALAFQIALRSTLLELVFHSSIT